MWDGGKGRDTVDVPRTLPTKEAGYETQTPRILRCMILCVFVSVAIIRSPRRQSAPSPHPPYMPNNPHTQPNPVLWN